MSFVTVSAMFAYLFGGSCIRTHLFIRSTMAAPVGVITCKRCSKGYITRQTSTQQNPMYECRFELCSDRSGCGYFRWLTPSSHYPPGWPFCDCGTPCDYFLQKQVFKCYNDTCKFQRKADPRSLVLDHSLCVRCRQGKHFTPDNRSLPSPNPAAASATASPARETFMRCLFPDTWDTLDIGMPLSSSRPVDLPPQMPLFQMPVPIITWVSASNDYNTFNVASLEGMELIFEPSRFAIQWRFPSPVPAEQLVIYTGFTIMSPASGDLSGLQSALCIDIGYFPTPFLIDIGRIVQHQPFSPWVVYTMPELLPVRRM